MAKNPKSILSEESPDEPLNICLVLMWPFLYIHYLMMELCSYLKEWDCYINVVYGSCRSDIGFNLCENDENIQVALIMKPAKYHIIW